MQTLVKIGSSNSSQRQHGRKDATEQMKNLTLARTRTQVLGISSADARYCIYIYIYTVPMRMLGGGIGCRGDIRMEVNVVKNNSRV